MIPPPPPYIPPPKQHRQSPSHSIPAVSLCFPPFRFCKEFGKLSREKGIALLQAKLLCGNFVEKLSTLLCDKMLKLAKGEDDQGAKPTRHDSKYALTAHPTLSYGSAVNFHQGLEGVLGFPSSNVREAMEFEHCDEVDSKEFFQAKNYETWTTSKIEWNFVVNPTEEGLRGLGLKDWPKDMRVQGPDPSSAGESPRRAMPIESYRNVLSMRNEQLEAQGSDPLRDEEFFGTRAFTGPMYLKYNATLRYVGERFVANAAGRPLDATVCDEFNSYWCVVTAAWDPHAGPWRTGMQLAEIECVA